MYCLTSAIKDEEEPVVHLKSTLLSLRLLDITAKERLIEFRSIFSPFTRQFFHSFVLFDNSHLNEVKFKLHFSRI